MFVKKQVPGAALPIHIKDIYKVILLENEQETPNIAIK